MRLIISTAQVFKNDLCPSRFAMRTTIRLGPPKSKPPSVNSSRLTVHPSSFTLFRKPRKICVSVIVDVLLGTTNAFR